MMCHGLYLPHHWPGHFRLMRKYLGSRWKIFLIPLLSIVKTKKQLTKSNDIDNADEDLIAEL